MSRVLIIGAGPGGIFTAYELMEKKPELKIAVFEMGHELQKRKCPIDGDKIKTYLASFKRFLICDNNENSILECIKTAINSDPVMRTPDALNPITISQNFLKI